MSLFDTLNNQHDGNDITRDDWKNGYTIFGFNLQPVITCAGDYLHSKKTASISAQMKFHKESISGLTGGRSISLIALLIYGSEFEITKEKKIIPSISLIALLIYGSEFEITKEKKIIPSISYDLL